jgi:tRNA1(Val) A37 N6-methylase TrmN6
LKIENVCLDLKQDFNALEIDFEEEFDLVFLHPPFWNIIRYSDAARDLSNAPTYNDFLNKLQTVLSLSVKALRNNGYLALPIGDFRKKGVYTYMARDIRDPADTKLVQEFIKTQHNVKSNAMRYSSTLVRIIHEHVPVWRKD